MNRKLIYLNLFLLSAAVLCFEIVSTRISSLIFAYDYAFIILSLAILGLGTGGIFSYYRIKNTEASGAPSVIALVLLVSGVSLLLFVIIVAELKLTNPFVYFFLLCIPFFLAGIVYAQLFKYYAEYSFKLYASDLAGAAVGSIGAIGVLNYLGAPNAVLFLAVILLACAAIFSLGWIKRWKLIASFSILTLSFVLLLLNGNTEILRSIHIGDFPEKDFYHIYPYVNTRATIIDSRWSIYGRSDLVSYSHQNMVRQLFIDGAAGTQMYRFNGRIKNADPLLFNLLIHTSTSIPFFFLSDSEKNNMAIIGPGGGKEVLIGLFGEIKEITGVEINPDFVKIVKDHKSFDGGIYSDFPNVHIVVGEGRHFTKASHEKYDLIVMSLPSTKQLQDIDNLAMNENYLLTVEAIKDYLNILTPQGRLIFTLHNRWELIRLIVTAVAAFEEKGEDIHDILDRIMILDDELAPTLEIRKTPFTFEEVRHTEDIMKVLPKDLPQVTYLPYHWSDLQNTPVNQLLANLTTGKNSLSDFVKEQRLNVSPCKDDSPYFYEIRKGVQENYLWLLIGAALFNMLVIGVPLWRIVKRWGVEKKASSNNKLNVLALPLVVFVCIGFGFMVLEVSLFQKFVLYLGSPTVSLSILLSSLLVGMGLGSFLGERMFVNNLKKRLYVVTALIAIVGSLIFVVYPSVLDSVLALGLVFRSLVCFFVLLPFGFLLGIPFPTAIQILKRNEMERYVPWMYGVNGTMSVLGSVSAIILSMQVGFTIAFFVGLLFYFIVFIVVRFYPAGFKTQ